MASYTKIIIIVIVVILGGGFFRYMYHPPAEVNSADAPQYTLYPVGSRIADGYRFYINYLLKFSVQYPEDLQIVEHGNGNTITLVFEDEKREKAFQVFVVPYNEQTVSEERFKMDVPSGVMKDPTQVVIDGGTATAFWSANNLFGGTREVWFIKNGFLYEVTTYKDLDPWLAKIMSTWKFL